MADETPHRIKRLGASVTQRAPLPALDGRPDAKTPGVERSTVCIRQYRTRLLDPDNLFASVKSLLDGLSEAGLITGDSSKEITLDVTQVKVAHRADQKTVIEIHYAEAPDGH